MSDAPPATTTAKPAKTSKPPPRTSQGSDPDRALYALLFFIAFAVGCYFLVRELRREARIQECVSRGRRDCSGEIDGLPPVNDR